MQTAQQTADAVVLSFIDALNKEDFQAARNCLADNARFEGVLGSRDGADTYIQDMQKMKFKYKLIRSFVNEQDVCLLYDIDMGGKTVFTCGWYQLQDDKIMSIKVVFDPRPVL